LITTKFVGAALNYVPFSIHYLCCAAHFLPTPGEMKR
jgi:hypothetical protein